MLPEKYLTQQWLAFQISGKSSETAASQASFWWYPGQGPYFGQATWFARFHSEKLPSAVDRYVNEIFRVTGVLDKALEGNENGWLVGDKLTYADLSFITWSSVGNGLLKELGKLEEFEQKFTIYTKWMRKMEEREAVKKIRDQMARGRAEHDLK
jgi:glutathione S-transferase